MSHLFTADYILTEVPVRIVEAGEVDRLVMLCTSGAAARIGYTPASFTQAFLSNHHVTIKLKSGMELWGLCAQNSTISVIVTEV